MSARSPPSCHAPDSKLNFRPVIGILTHPGDGASGRLSNHTNASYIAASYVKFVESAGARVIPIIYNEPLEIIYEVCTCFCLDKVDCIDSIWFLTDKKRALRILFACFWWELLLPGLSCLPRRP